MLSMLDAYLDRPLKDIIKELSLTNEIKKAILNHEGKMGYVLKLIILFEQAEWKKLSELELQYDLESTIVFNIYKEAIDYAAETIGNLSLNK